METTQELPTTDVPLNIERDRHGRLYRRLAIGVIVVIVALGAAGVFGVRSATVAAHRRGLDLSVRYPRTTRAGLPAAFKIQVSADDPITEPVTIAISAAYLDLFDQQGLRPEPTGSTTRGNLLVWEFDPPLRGRTLVVRLDVIVETGRHFGKEAIVAVLDDAGAVTTKVRLDTNIAP